MPPPDSTWGRYYSNKSGRFQWPLSLEAHTQKLLDSKERIFFWKAQCICPLLISCTRLERTASLCRRKEGHFEVALAYPSGVKDKSWLNILRPRLPQYIALKKKTQKKTHTTLEGKKKEIYLPYSWLPATAPMQAEHHVPYGKIPKKAKHPKFGESSLLQCGVAQSC